MPKEKLPKGWVDHELRQMVYDLVGKHYNEVHKENKKFVPGETMITHSGRVYDAEEMKMLVDAALDFWLTEGRFTKKFQEDFSKFLDVKYCIPTNSGSSANLLAVSALTSPKLAEKRLLPGDEVITAALAFPTTVNPIVQNNLVPVFLDCDLETCNLRADQMESALTKKTKAVFVAHTLGNPFDLDSVLRLCEKYNLWLIEDNCDALGSTYRGKQTGTFGHLATFSFYPPHHITTGEGGAVVTNDGLLKTIIESFQSWGRDCWCDPGKDNTCGKRFDWQQGSLPHGYDHKFIFSHLGYNLKWTDMQAAVGVAQLKKLPGFIEARKRNWNRLLNAFKKYESFFHLPLAAANSDPSWFGFSLVVKEGAPFSRHSIVQYLEENKIRTRMHFSGNITRHPAYEGIAYRVHGDLKYTDLVMHNGFWIGVYPGLTSPMIDFIINVFDAFIQKETR